MGLWKFGAVKDRRYRRMSSAVISSSPFSTAYAACKKGRLYLAFMYFPAAGGKKPLGHVSEKKKAD